MRSISSITAMLRSAKPFVCCDRLEDSRTCVPIRFWNSSQNLDVNMRSRSLTSDCGTQFKLVHIQSIHSSTDVSVSAFFQVGMAYLRAENRSTMTHKVSYPWIVDGGRSVKKSIDIDCPGPVGCCKG